MSLRPSKTALQVLAGQFCVVQVRAEARNTTLQLMAMNAPTKRPSRVLQVLAALNLLCLLALWPIENLLGERWWLSTIIAYVPQHPFVLPSFILLLISLWKRDAVANRINALALLFGWFELLNFQMPLPLWLFPARSPFAKSASKKQNLRVMTYNVRAIMWGAAGVARTIRAQKPDVVCIQEAWQSPGFPDATTALAPLLPGYEFRRAREVTTFSRWPICSSRVVDFNDITLRQVLETIIEVEGRKMTIVTAHFGSARLQEDLPIEINRYKSNMYFSNQVRGNQFEIVRATALHSGLPFIICGDFNTPPRGRFFRRYNREFCDAFGLRGWGFGHTFDSRLPLIRIDYQWSRADWTPIDAFVPYSRASDHFPLVVDYPL